MGWAHGTSHHYVARRALEMMGKDAKDLKSLPANSLERGFYYRCRRWISADTLWASRH